MKKIVSILMVLIISSAAVQVLAVEYTVIALNPSGFTSSAASGISGNQQVGYGAGPATGYSNHALLWNGSATDYVDLHQFLPAGFISSFAESIDSYGNISGYATDSTGYPQYAVVWIVPEPGTMGLLAIGAMILRNKSKKKRSKCE